MKRIRSRKSRWTKQMICDLIIGCVGIVGAGAAAGYLAVGAFSPPEEERQNQFSEDSSEDASDYLACFEGTVGSGIVDYSLADQSSEYSEPEQKGKDAVSSDEYMDSLADEVKAKYRQNPEVFDRLVDAVEQARQEGLRHVPLKEGAISLDAVTLETKVSDQGKYLALVDNRTGNEMPLIKPEYEKNKAASRNAGFDMEQIKTLFKLVKTEYR